MDASSTAATIPPTPRLSTSRNWITETLIHGSTLAAICFVLHRVISSEQRIKELEHEVDDMKISMPPIVVEEKQPVRRSNANNSQKEERVEEIQRVEDDDEDAPP